MERYKQWTEYLPIIEHEMNSAKHDTTGFSPNDLRFAVKPRGLVDLFYPLEGTSDSAECLVEDLKNKQDEARDSIAVAQWKQKKYFDGKRQNKEFNVGDLVVLKFNRFGLGYKPPKPHDHKLAPIGTPLRIVKKLSPLSYCLALPDDTRIHDVISIIHLRRYRGSGEGIRPPLIAIDNEEEYEVEHIDGERINSRAYPSIWLSGMDMQTRREHGNRAPISCTPIGKSLTGIHATRSQSVS